MNSTSELTGKSLMKTLREGVKNFTEWSIAAIDLIRATDEFKDNMFEINALDAELTSLNKLCKVKGE